MPTSEEIQKYLSKMGKRGEKTLSLLGQNMDFIKAINTELGKELLGDLVQTHEELLEKISEITASDEDKMMYKLARKLLLTWSGRVVAYNRRISEIIKTE